MNIDMTIHKGSPERPIAIFIHGLGVDKGFWIDPVNTRVLGKSIPMAAFAAKKPAAQSSNKKQSLTVGAFPKRIENLWTVLNAYGFSSVSWSQKRPVGPISIAVEELDAVFSQVRKEFPGKSIALIGHSRGGLVARKFMETKRKGVKALITIATPHAGSSLSRFGKYLHPLAPVARKLLPGHAHSTASDVIMRINDLLEGKALKELLPGSDFFKTLHDSPHNDIVYLSFGGTSTRLLTVYSWIKMDDMLLPKTLLNVPDSLLKVLPAQIIPDELTSGKGDFMVTADSAVLPWASEHYNVPANHISISWNKKVIRKTLEAIENILL